MAKSVSIKTLLAELGGGMGLAKCRRCGCMQGALETVASVPANGRGKEAVGLRERAARWLAQMEPVQYT